MTIEITGSMAGHADQHTESSLAESFENAYFTAPWDIYEGPLKDFPKEKIRILTFYEATETPELLVVLPLSIVADCYNLMLEASPLMLTRSAHDNQFQIIWPERRDFAIEDHEFFEFLEGNRLYTSVWYEDPDYREELLVRDYNTGEVLERIPGNFRRMPDGSAGSSCQSGQSPAWCSLRSGRCCSLLPDTDQDHGR